MTDFFGSHYNSMYRGPPTTIRPGGGVSPLIPLALDLQTTNKRNTEHISHSTTSTAPR